MCCHCSCIHLRSYITQCREYTQTLLHLQFPVQDLAQPQCKSKEHALLASLSVVQCGNQMSLSSLCPPPPNFVRFFDLFFCCSQSCISMHIKALVEEKGCLMLFWISYCGSLGVMACTICIVNIIICEIVYMYATFALQCTCSSYVWPCRINGLWRIMLMKLRSSSGTGEVKQSGRNTHWIISSRASSWPIWESWAFAINSATFVNVLVLRKFSSFRKKTEKMIFKVCWMSRRCM